MITFKQEGNHIAIEMETKQMMVTDQVLTEEKVNFITNTIFTLPFVEEIKFKLSYLALFLSSEGVKKTYPQYFSQLPLPNQ